MRLFFVNNQNDIAVRICFIRGTIDEIYPSPWILPRARQLGIRAMINADAHRPDDVDCCFPRMRAALAEAGYAEIWALLGGEWVATPL